MNLDYARLAPLARTVLQQERLGGDELRRAAADVKLGFEPEAARHKKIAELAKPAENEARKFLVAQGKRLPIAPWIESVYGIGPAVYLFIGLIGDPLWNGADDRPRRGPYELKAYLGLDPVDGRARRRRKGAIANWNAEAKGVLLGRIADSAYRQGHYRPVYLARREKDAGAVHAYECLNAARPVNGGPPSRTTGCGTRKHPEWGEIGSPLRNGHKHSRALRAVAEAFIFDLWDAAKAAQ